MNEIFENDLIVKYDIKYTGIFHSNDNIVDEVSLEIRVI